MSYWIGTSFVRFYVNAMQSKFSNIGIYASYNDRNSDIHS